MPASGPVGENQLATSGVMPWHEGLRVKNVFAGTLAVGTLVYVNGTTTDPSRGDDVFATVTKADADATAPANVAMYVVTEAMGQNDYGKVSKYLVQRGVDTSTYTTVGDPAYLSTTAGTSTATRPTAAAANKQRVGFCAKKHASQGILVFDLRSNGVEEFGSGSYGGISGGNVATVADQAAGAVSAANFGVPVEVALTIPAGATGNVDFTGWPFKMRVRSVGGYKTAAPGGGAGTVQVQNGTGGANITDAISINVNDETTLQATTISDANQDIAAGATVRVVRTRTASTSEACVLILRGVRVA